MIVWDMNISTEQIQAFLEVSRKGSFSKAALGLGLTQAALSIRIKKLEENLEKSLIIRGKSGLSITEAGQDFLVFAETFESLKNEYLGTSKDSSKLSGNLRVGCFSTIGRSLVLPALQKILCENDNVSFSFIIKEIHELYPLLQSGEVDIILLDHEFERDGFIQTFLGFEEYVLVTGKKKKNQDIYLNHDENDLTTYKYYESIDQKKTKLKRRYLDEIYSVLDGVAVGMGVSVLPIHLANEDSRIVVPTPNKKLKSPVYVCYKRRSYYTNLFQKSLESIEEFMKNKLRQK